MAKKILKSKIRTKQGLVGYVNNLFKDMDKIYAAYDIGKLELSLNKYVIEDNLVKLVNLCEKINDNIEDEEGFQKELSQSLRFEEQVKFQLKQFEKFIFENKEIPIVNQISTDNSRRLS